MMVSTASTSTSLKEYLKKYESNAEVEKKKKKKKKPKAVASGVLVVDEDPVWQKPVDLEEDEGNDSPDEKPMVDEDIELKRMRRLEQLKARRAYNALSEDGSGWVSVSDAPKESACTYPGEDVSPNSKKTRRYDTPSPENRQNVSDSSREDVDLSPPRQRRKRSDSLSPEPGQKPSDFQREESDLSLPRQREGRHYSMSSQLELQFLDASKEEMDLSPPRQRRRRYNSPSPEDGNQGAHVCQKSDLSPLRRHESGSGSRSSIHEKNPSVSGASKEDADLTPPRQRRRRYDSPSPEHGKQGADLSQKSDLSRSRRHGRSSGSHSSMPEKNPAFSGVKNTKLDDLSPPRRARPNSTKLSASHGSEDLSPPRKNRKGIGKMDPNENAAHPTPMETDLSPPRKKKNQMKTGLITGKDVNEEIAKTKKDELSRFMEMDPSISGRGAEPVYRIKGERVSKDEYLKLTKKEEKPKEEKKLEWGKGLAQKREAEERLLELEREKDKPFARSRDDQDLDRMMRDRLRWGDPMAHLVKKKQSDLVLPDLGENDKMRESGFIIPQEIPSHSWMKRGLDFAPNRYGIKPGRHWDGVDRSNGYERQLFKRMSEKRATEREAYLWSVSDM